MDDAFVPLTPAQRRTWRVDQTVPGAALRHRALAVRARGRLDPAALCRSVRAVVTRHDVLRTTVRVDGDAETARTPAGEPLALPELDATAPGGTDRVAAAVEELPLRSTWSPVRRCGPR